MVHLVCRQSRARYSLRSTQFQLTSPSMSRTSPSKERAISEKNAASLSEPVEVVVERVEEDESSKKSFCSSSRFGTAEGGPTDEQP
mmetsp:Transcript_4911/g.8518  ORF Transcript_4911/g.8518 Transcript_4911/m.8518 type:complete len:86 (-) Transcript_4911:103-360(-)